MAEPEGDRVRPSVSEPPSLVGVDFEGRYHVETLLGAGGAGAVYRAQDLKLQRPVALKVLHEHFGVRKSLRRRFEREARALAALTHPNVVAILDYGVSSEMPYLVMELLEGRNLAELLKETSPLRVDRAFEIVRQLLRGMSFVHEQGLVHRDLKPGNVFLQALPDGHDHVKLLDFGLAKFLEAGDEESTLTRTGDIFGTPGYMPPEQLVGERSDTRADVYAIASILFEMLAGRRPFTGEVHDMLRRQLTDEPPTLDDVCPARHATPELAAFLKKALAQDPATRFKDAADMAGALEQLPQPAVEGSSAEDTGGPSSLELATTMMGSATQAEHDAQIASRREAERHERWRPAGMRPLFGGAKALLVLMVVGGAVTGLYLAERKPEEPPVEAFQRFSKTAQQRLKPLLQGEEDPAAKGTQQAAETASPSSAGQQPEPKQPQPNEQKAGRTEGADTKTVARTATSKEPSSSEKPQGTGDEKVSATNPWRRRAPTPLRKLHQSIEQGSKSSERAISYLRRHNMQHPNDARGHLLLAGIYLNRAWLSDAVTQYDFAYQRDPSVRGDPDMLRNLIRLAAKDTTHREATALLRKAYGREALPTLRRAIKAMSDNQAAVRRLKHTRRVLQK